MTPPIQSNCYRNAARFGFTIEMYFVWRPADVAKFAFNLSLFNEKDLDWSSIVNAAFALKTSESCILSREYLCSYEDTCTTTAHSVSFVSTKSLRRVVILDSVCQRTFVHLQLYKNNNMTFISFKRSRKNIYVAFFISWLFNRVMTQSSANAVVEKFDAVKTSKIIKNDSFVF